MPYTYELTRADEGSGRRLGISEDMDPVAARRQAIERIRRIVADGARHGLIDLRGRIDIRNEAGEVVTTVRLREAFHVQDGVVLSAVDR